MVCVSKHFHLQPISLEFMLSKEPNKALFRAWPRCFRFGSITHAYCNLRYKDTYFKNEECQDEKKLNLSWTLFTVKTCALWQKAHESWWHLFKTAHLCKTDRSRLCRSSSILCFLSILWNNHMHFYKGDTMYFSITSCFKKPADIFSRYLLDSSRCYHQLENTAPAAWLLRGDVKYSLLFKTSLFSSDHLCVLSWDG